MSRRIVKEAAPCPLNRWCTVPVGCYGRKPRMPDPTRVAKRKLQAFQEKFQCLGTDLHVWAETQERQAARMERVRTNALFSGETERAELAKAQRDRFAAAARNARARRHRDHPEFEVV